VRLHSTRGEPPRWLYRCGPGRARARDLRLYVCRNPGLSLPPEQIAVAGRPPLCRCRLRVLRPFHQSRRIPMPSPARMAREATATFLHPAIVTLVQLGVGYPSCLACFIDRRSLSKDVGDATRRASHGPQAPRCA